MGVTKDKFTDYEIADMAKDQLRHLALDVIDLPIRCGFCGVHWATIDGVMEAVDPVTVLPYDPRYFARLDTNSQKRWMKFAQRNSGVFVFCRGKDCYGKWYESYVLGLTGRSSDEG